MQLAMAWIFVNYFLSNTTKNLTMDKRTYYCMIYYHIFIVTGYFVYQVYQYIVGIVMYNSGIPIQYNKSSNFVQLKLSFRNYRFIEDCSAFHKWWGRIYRQYLLYHQVIARHFILHLLLKILYSRSLKKAVKKFKHFPKSHYASPK